LFEELARAESPGRAGTRIWTARECIYKAFGTRTAALSAKGRHTSAVLLHAQTDTGEHCLILTLPVTFTLGRERMVASIVEPATERPKPVPETPLALTTAGFDPTSYTLSADESSGAFIVRWPVTLKEGANLDGTVYFTHYSDWMGKVRELAMQPIAEQFGAQLATGRWGMVTNRSSLTVLGEARLEDVMEARYWIQRAPEQPRSTIDLHFEWLRVARNGTIERAALGEMRTTWVALVGHGQARPEDFPDYFQAFIDARAPREAVSLGRRRPLPEPLGALDAGKLVFRRPGGPRQGPVLARRAFATSLQDANAVGNIYFSNYYYWQGRLVDGYLQRLIPEVYRARSGLGEARCTQARVSHLADAMPFDDVEVTMSLEALHESAVTFGFEYFRVESDGSKRKLAIGQQDCVWLTGPAGARRAGRLPAVVVEDLLRRTT
jgi:acyl-CoA thioesterase FadM